MVSVATCLNKNDGVKMAQRWCRGPKNSKYQKPCLGMKEYKNYSGFQRNPEYCSSQAKKAWKLLELSP